MKETEDKTYFRYWGKADVSNIRGGVAEFGDQLSCFQR
jgi:hypothetical protein